MVVLIALAKPLGAYMARVYEGQSIGLDRVLGPVERLIYRLCGVNPQAEMNWKTYAVAMLLFNLFGLIVVYLLQRLQGVLPLNPQGLGAVSPDSSFNTAVSFATNTNWQGYGGETTMSYLTQMLALTVQNFVSAATGMAMLVALIRGLRARIGADDRQLLGRSDAHDAVHPAAAVDRAGLGAGVAGRGAELQRLSDGATCCKPTTDANGNAVTTASAAAWARRPRRSRSSSWAPTAAASSTSTRRIRLRTPRRCRTSSSCCRSC